MNTLRPLMIGLVAGLLVAATATTGTADAWTGLAARPPAPAAAQGETA